MKPIVFTKQGYEDIQQEQIALVEKRRYAVEQVQKARAMGDLSENGFYKAAKFELGNIDRRLRQLKELIKCGKVVQTTQKEIVDVGSTVTISDGKEEKTFVVVGGYESDPSLGKISHISPIGKAIMGKRKGESVTVTIPSGAQTYKILGMK